MKLFSMLESVFFVTLGISCVLLMLLIYHFKQRLTKLEQSSEMMFELLNNIVGELSGIKQTFIVEPNQPTVDYPMTMQFSDKIPVVFSDNESEGNSLPELTHNNDGTYSDVENSDDDNSDIDTDSAEENDSDDDNSDNDTDSDEESDSDDESNLKEETQEVKVVSVDMDNSNEMEASSESIDNSEELLIESLDEPEVQPAEIDTEEIEKIHVNKLDTTDDLEETDSQQSSSSNSIDIYRKMNVPSLKSLVIEKGLSSDPSKMKKNELIALLETNI